MMTYAQVSIIITNANFGLSKTLSLSFIIIIRFLSDHYVIIAKGWRTLNISSSSQYYRQNHALSISYNDYEDDNNSDNNSNNSRINNQKNNEYDVNNFGDNDCHHDEYD